MRRAAANRLRKVERPPRDEFAKIWLDPDISQRQVAKIFGISKTLCGVIASEYDLPYRSRFTNCVGAARRNRDPSPEEIEEMCLEIQKTWSDAERQRRSFGGKKRPIPTPQVSYGSTRLVG